MKPFGGLVHLRRGTVALPLVLWLCAGSIPAAFSGVLVLRALGEGANVEAVVEKALGARCCWPRRGWWSRRTCRWSAGPGPTRVNATR